MASVGCRDTLLLTSGLVRGGTLEHEILKEEEFVNHTVDLERFVVAQDSHHAYARARDEVASGHKVSHWMWFVFPQLAGLGSSVLSRTYAIADMDEARAYLAHPVLGPRLREITEVANQHDHVPPTSVFGPDSVKLHSCATLFFLASGEQVFRDTLDIHFSGVLDHGTTSLLGEGTPGTLTVSETSRGSPNTAASAARRAVHEATSVTVLTGAGISTGSGIPDFRGPEGLWTKDPTAERLANIDHCVNSPDVRVASWQRQVELRGLNPQPNAAHRALVTFERTGKLRALVTQNIDGLHLAAGSDPALVLEVHGNSRRTRCLRCGAELATTEVLDRVEAGELDPHCSVPLDDATCGGILKTAVVSFGQPLPNDVFAEAEFRTKSSDLLMCVGSSLGVRPVSGLVDKALTRGRRLIIVNGEPTVYDRDADIVVRGDIVTVLGDILEPL
jgi:NAD-dependent deacetylase